MNRYVCIHGHFYQPPRENPWLEEVEVQDAAYPYHDWNERITAECYAPNAASRILDQQRRIIDIVNNYTKISYNFGPTLLSWLERHRREVYESVLEADKESRERFSGHGAALAQAYNHMIMPLANSRDKRTQIRWGIRDFEYRFRRKPEGMWLPETAVDIETLEMMADEGIGFTILAPHQAGWVRKIGEKEWREVKAGKLNTYMPYVCRLPSGRALSIFFYIQPIAQEVAFGELLRSGEALAKRMLGAFSEGEGESQLVHFATDGETFGHHHRFGDMALAYCLYQIEAEAQAQITVYGEYLERFPPTHEVKIHEDTSWSCVHGIERWRSDCGCYTGKHPEWSQEWREGLREGMDWLRGELIPVYERGMEGLVKDPWGTRDDYIEVVLDRSREQVEKFIARHAGGELREEEKRRLLQLLEMQRNAMLMYTSCGWFFEDLAGTETVQVIEYASRAIQLGAEVSGRELEEGYLKYLERARSNAGEFGNGAEMYGRLVKPARLDLLRVGAHYAISSLFEEYPECIEIGCYTSRSQAYEVVEMGVQRLAVGRARIRSTVTWAEKEVSFGVLHFGDHNLLGGVREDGGEEQYVKMCERLKEAFLRSDITEVVRLMEGHFGGGNYSLWHLFRDEQRKILGQILDSTLEDMERSFRQLSEYHYPIMQVLRERQVPLPKALAVPIEFILNVDLRRALEKEQIELDELEVLVEKMRRLSLEPERTTLSYVASERINELIERLSRAEEEASLWETIEGLFKVLGPLSLGLDLWKAQNSYFGIGKHRCGEMRGKAEKGEASAQQWLEHFERLGDYLGVRCV